MLYSISFVNKSLSLSLYIAFVCSASFLADQTLITNVHNKTSGPAHKGSNSVMSYITDGE